MNIFKILGAALLYGMLVISTTQSSTNFDSFDYDSPDALSSQFLRPDFRDAYKAVDEASSLLQYVVQILNRGALTIPNKSAAKNWAFEHVKIAYALRKIEDGSSEQTLFTLLSTTKSFVNHILRTVKSNFRNLDVFELPYIEKEDLSTVEARDAHYSRIQLLIETNKNLLAEFKYATKTMGLSWVNLTARKIDGFDTKYGISKTLEQIPRFVGLAGLILYALPEHRVATIPLIGTLKKYIGSPEYVEQDAKRNVLVEEGKQNADNVDVDAPKKVQSLASFLRGPDVKPLQVLVPLAFATLSQEFFNWYTIPVKKLLRPLWNELKGFELPQSSRYKHPGITLEDPRLIGLESQIEEMREVVRYLMDPETFDRANCNIEKGILLEGPSRTGKTLLANALCGTINEQLNKRGINKQFAFREIKATEINRSYDGIRGLIQDAKDNAPCVLFIDELHTLRLQTKEGTDGEVLNQFLTMAEELHSNEIGDAVILLAATNRAYMLDDALLKPERFGKVIHFENSTFETRRLYFIEMFKYNALETNLFDIDLLARQTEGCSYGDLNLIFKNARFSARSKSRAICQNDFEDKIHRYIYRIHGETKLALSLQEKQVIAAHIAGQALMYIHNEEKIPERIEVATIRGIWPKIVEARFFDAEAVKQANEKNKMQFGHIFTSHRAEKIPFETDPMLICKIKIAGTLAQELLLGKIQYGYRPQDKHEALALLESFLYNGLKKEHFTKAEHAELLVQVKVLLKKCEDETRAYLSQHSGLLKKLATELETKEIIAARDMKAIVQQQ
ncbi:AAA family ATPase [Candidatus Dependentiae bacterium]|nr:AAA family ATPase [Candidatus Dependentiae bacterium]